MHDRETRKPRLFRPPSWRVPSAAPVRCGACGRPLRPPADPPCCCAHARPAMIRHRN